MSNNSKIIFSNTISWPSNELIFTSENEKLFIGCYYSTWYKQNGNGLSFPSYKEAPKTALDQKLNSLTIQKIDEVAKKFRDVVFVFPPHKEGKGISAPHIYEHVKKQNYKMLLISSKDYPKLSYSHSREERLSILKDAELSFVIETTPQISENTNFVFVDDIFTSGTTMTHVMSYLEKNGKIKLIKSERTGGFKKIENWFGIFNGRSMISNESKKKHVNVQDDKLYLEIIKQYESEYNQISSTKDENTLDILLRDL